jgi:hypothetical protein
MLLHLALNVPPAGTVESARPTQHDGVSLRSSAVKWRIVTGAAGSGVRGSSGASAELAPVWQGGTSAGRGLAAAVG